MAAPARHGVDPARGAFGAGEGIHHGGLPDAGMAQEHGDLAVEVVPQLADGVAVEGVQVEDIGTTSKTMPEFPQIWASMISAGPAGADTVSTETSN